MANYTIGKIKIEQEIGKFLVVQFQSMAITRAMITVDIVQFFKAIWNRSLRIVLQKQKCDLCEILWSSVSGEEQKEQSDVDDSPHFDRFFRVGSVLLIYRMVKLKMFFGNNDICISTYLTRTITNICFELTS
ncbi:Hypothetical predicted protein [Paramuricea clavata]|uniref:Uncharacterized protein n=1 Tax=Paramuricea clavata TaxID=317549 RepID=A0A6S7GD69_PARCT|nr:Hypothetical predicted protein [Paramuricea clavata]